MSMHTVTTRNTPIFGRAIPFLALLFALLVLPAAAQNEHEMIVEPDQPGTLNDAIMGDTLANGDRVDPDRIYVLRRGGYYYLNRELTNQGHVLHLKAEPGEGPLPVVAPAVDQAGVSPDPAIRLLEDAYFEDIYFLNVDNAGTIRGIGIDVNKEGQRVVVNNCVLEGARGRFFRINAEHTKVYVTNSVFRNFFRSEMTNNGRPFEYRGSTGYDSLYVENNTFEAITGFVVRGNGTSSGVFHFNHNTMYLTRAEVITDAFGGMTIDLTVTNNLFVDVLAFGAEDTTEGLFSIDSLDTQEVYQEDDRTFTFANNNVYYTPDLQNYWATADMDDSVFATPRLIPDLLDSTAYAYIADHPQVTVANNTTEPVEFTNAPSLDGFFAWWDAINAENPEPPLYMFASENRGMGQNEWIPIDWPIPSDYSYPTSSPLYTAAEGGFPVGDLNWFPAKKAEWEQSIITDAEGEAELPGAFRLEGNYPNPFNPTTTIQFDLPAAAEVEITVYDLLGRQVMVVPKQQLAAGTNQRVSLDASALSSGTYLYRVEAEFAGREAAVRMGKMVLVK